MTSVEISLAEAIVPRGLGVVLLIGLILALVLLYRFSVGLSAKHDLDGKREDLVLLFGFLTLSLAMIGTTFALLAHDKTEADWSSLTSVVFKDEPVNAEQLKKIKNLEAGQYALIKDHNVVVLRESRADFIVASIEEFEGGN